MLTKIFTIYVIFCAICFLYLVATVITIAWDIHRRNPNLKPQSSNVAAIASLFKMLVICVIPIFNVGVFYVCLCCYEQLSERMEQALL